jgi:hypothetical protein
MEIPKPGHNVAITAIANHGNVGSAVGGMQLMSWVEGPYALGAARRLDEKILTGTDL